MAVTADEFRKERPAAARMRHEAAEAKALLAYMEAVRERMVYVAPQGSGRLFP